MATAVGAGGGQAGRYSACGIARSQTAELLGLVEVEGELQVEAPVQADGGGCLAGGLGQAEGQDASMDLPLLRLRDQDATADPER